MPRITPTDWRTQVNIFEAFGCIFVRQKGDHLIYRCPNSRRPFVIPRYSEITVTIIRNNIRVVGMSREVHFALLEQSG